MEEHVYNTHNIQYYGTMKGANQSDKNKHGYM